MTIADIPDVLHLIGQHLNTYDLVACVQVNHIWNDVFTAHLWRSIDDSQRPWRRLLAQFSDKTPTYFFPEQQLARLVGRVPDELLDLFVKYGHHIRRMVIRRPHTLELCLRARQQALLALQETMAADNVVAAGSKKRLLPCEGITVLRFGFLDPVLTFLKRLDRLDSPTTPYLTALSAVLRNNQRELEPALTGVHPSLFHQEFNAVDHKLHMVILARSCWQLVLNNPQLQELDMGPFGVHEEAFMVAGRFLKAALASRSRIRALRVGVEKTPDFLVHLPTTLPNLRMLWYHDWSPAGCDRLVEAMVECRLSGTQGPGASSPGGAGVNVNDGTERMPDLRLLDIVAPTQPQHLAAIFTSFPALVMLSLGVLNPDDDGDGASLRNALNRMDIQDRASSPPPPPRVLPTHLQELHVTRWECTLEQLVSYNIRFDIVTRLNLHAISGYKKLLDLLRGFPSLQELRLKKVRTTTSDPEVNYETEPPFTTIRSVHLAKDAFKKEEALHGLISLLPKLAEFNVYTIFRTTIATLISHCPLFEILEFSQSSDYVDQLGLLVTTCPTLKSCVGPGLCISAQEIIQQPWVCPNLQKLTFTLTGANHLTQDDIATIIYIRSKYSQNLILPITFDMPRHPPPSPLYTNEDNWDMWHPKDQVAHRRYCDLKHIYCSVFEHIKKYTALDTVQPDISIKSERARSLWTSSTLGRPVSSMGRPLKQTSRVLSDNQSRWIYLPSL
ncbi:hypothetical protein BGX23_010002 [Mortierella sp. AD031]|nr:hypothetical protein BGX23_010002 [Mortierella sp. AD031]